MRKFTQKNNNGFTLVETLVAISIFSLSILGLLSILSQGIADTGYAKKKITATYLAQEGIEYIRNTRDTYVLYPGATTNWTIFQTKLSSCLSGGAECGFDDSVAETSVGSVFQCSLSASQCKLYVNNGGYDNNTAGTDSGFVRKIWVTIISPNEMRIFSDVSWQQGSGNYDITFSEDLFNWVQ
jgi:prepilin-type N-terminal cleavage/methylation domain-containing protein